MSGTEKPLRIDRSLCADFVDYLFSNKENKEFMSVLRRADDPSSEFYSWGVLARFNIDIESPSQRIPFSFIAASIAKTKSKENGTMTLGKAILKAHEKFSVSSAAELRLQRLLACSGKEEACNVLRPIMSLINNRVEQALDYATLLDEICRFSLDTKIRWSQQFYRLNNESSINGERQ